MVLHRREQDSQHLHSDVLSLTGAADSQLAAVRRQLAASGRDCSNACGSAPAVGLAGHHPKTGVVVEDGILSDDRKTLNSSLCNEDAIEWITMDGRKRCGP